MTVSVTGLLEREAAKRGRFILAVFVLLFVNLQGDSFWLGAQGRHAALSCLGGLIFVSLVGALGWPALAALLGKRHAPGTHDARKYWLAIVVLLQAASGVLFVIASRHYRFAGYHLYPRTTCGVFIFACGGFLWLLWTGKRTTSAFVLSFSLISLAAVMALSIASFPLTALRSDMLPLISAAGREIMSGNNPYHYYHLLDGDVFLTYLPGTWAAFLPAVWLGFDLRFVTLICELATLLALWMASRLDAREPVAWLLAMFAVSPYLQYRHDIYTPVHWLFLACALIATFRGKVTLGAVLMGISTAMSQFSWVIMPFWVLHLLQRYGWRTAAKETLIAIGSGLACVAPFLGQDRRSLTFGVLGHWQNDLAAPVSNLALLVVQTVGIRWLQILQALVLILIFLVGFWRRSCRTASGTMCLILFGLTAFVMLNRIVWGYFYLLLELTVLLYVMAANGWLKLDTQRLDPDTQRPVEELTDSAYD